MALDLTRKVGPLPVWGWGAIGVAVIGGVYLWKKHSSSSTSSPTLATGATAVPATYPVDTSGGGGYGGGGGYPIPLPPVDAGAGTTTTTTTNPTQTAPTKTTSPAYTFTSSGFGPTTGPATSIAGVLGPSGVTYVPYNPPAQTTTYESPTNPGIFGTVYAPPVTTTPISGTPPTQYVGANGLPFLGGPVLYGPNNQPMTQPPVPAGNSS